MTTGTIVKGLIGLGAIAGVYYLFSQSHSMSEPIKTKTSEPETLHGMPKVELNKGSMGANDAIAKSKGQPTSSVANSNIFDIAPIDYATGRTADVQQISILQY